MKPMQHTGRRGAYGPLLGLVVFAALSGCNEAGQSDAARNQAAVNAYNNRRTEPVTAAGQEIATLTPPAMIETAAPEASAALVQTPPAVTPPAKPESPVVAAQSSAPSAKAPPAPPAARPGGLPAGAGRDTVQRVCTSCHAIGMVTAKGRTPDGWSEIIGRMMGLGLEASDEDLQTIHAYLSRELPPR